MPRLFQTRYSPSFRQTHFALIGQLTHCIVIGRTPQARIGNVERMRMSFIARYVYTQEEFVIVTEAPQCNKMTATGQVTDNTNNKKYTIGNVQKSKNTIYNIDNYVCTYRYEMCKLKWK